MKKFLTLLLVGAGLSMAAQAKDAKCKIVFGDEWLINDTCTFTSINGDGSFILSGERGFYNEIQAVKIVLKDKDVANMFISDNGTWKNWGKAIRSKSQPACWSGKPTKMRTSYQICVYAK